MGLVGTELLLAVTLDKGWARETPPGSSVTAIYGEFKNPKATRDELLSVSSPLGKVEIHESSMEAGMMSYTRQRMR